jgi:hypothetical protein
MLLHCLPADVPSAHHSASIRLPLELRLRRRMLWAKATAAATLVIRFGTLWFGVALGMVTLGWFNRRYPENTEGEAA